MDARPSCRFQSSDLYWLKQSQTLQGLMPPIRSAQRTVIAAREDRLSNHRHDRRWIILGQARDPDRRTSWWPSRLRSATC